MRREDLEHRREPVFERLALDLCRCDLLLEIVPAVVHDFEQQLLAGAELVLDRTPRDTRAARDLVRTGLVVALLQNALDGRLHDTSARCFAVGPPASRLRDGLFMRDHVESVPRPCCGGGTRSA